MVEKDYLLKERSLNIHSCSKFEPKMEILFPDECTERGMLHYHSLTSLFQTCDVNPTDVEIDSSVEGKSLLMEIARLIMIVD
jgi:hypothetical protein